QSAGEFTNRLSRPGCGVVASMGKRSMPETSPNAGPHVPVLLDEVLSALSPLAGKRIIDGTFGAGGYSRALLEAGASVIAIDRDPSVQPFADALTAEFG